MSLSFKICLYNHIHHLAEESEFPCGDFPGGPVIKNPLGNAEDVDLILAWELRSNTPWSNSAHAATTEPVCSRVCAPQLEKPGTAASEAGTPARESLHHKDRLSMLQGRHEAMQQRPDAAK